MNRDTLQEPKHCFQGKEESCTVPVLPELVRHYMQTEGCGKAQSKILPLAAFTCCEWPSPVAQCGAQEER